MMLNIDKEPIATPITKRPRAKKLNSISSVSARASTETSKTNAVAASRSAPTRGSGAAPASGFVALAGMASAGSATMRADVTRGRRVDWVGFILLATFMVALGLHEVIVGVLVATTAHAQNAAWCLKPAGDRGSTQRCTYASFQQCLADRTGNGFCIQNSTSQPPSPPIRRR